MKKNIVDIIGFTSILLVGIVYFFLRPLFTVLQEVYAFPDVNFVYLSLPFFITFVFIKLLEFLNCNFKLTVNNETLVCFTLVSSCLFFSSIVQVFSFSSLISAHTVTFSDFLKVTASSIYGYITLFVVGLCFYRILKVESVSKLFISLWLIISLFLIFTGLTTSSGIFLDGLYSYLTVSDSYAILSLITISALGLNNSKYSEYLKVICFLITSYCLFSLVSRTAFYFFIAASSILFILKPKTWLFGSIIIFIGLVFILPLLQEFFWVDSSKWLSYDRMFRVVDQIDSDNSFNERLHYNAIGLNSIQKNWFLGDFMGEFRINMEGKYMHNYLSFYRQFGLVPFLLLCISAFVIILRSIILFLLFRSRSRSFDNGVAAICIFILLEAVFSRAYWYPYVFFMLGISISFCNAKLMELRTK